MSIPDPNIEKARIIEPANKTRRRPHLSRNFDIISGNIKKQTEYIL